MLRLSVSKPCFSGLSVLQELCKPMPRSDLKQVTSKPKSAVGRSVAVGMGVKMKRIPRERKRLGRELRVGAAWGCYLHGHVLLPVPKSSPRSSRFLACLDPTATPHCTSNILELNSCQNLTMFTMSRKDMKPRILRHDWGSGKKFLACFENRRGRLHVSLVRSIPSPGKRWIAVEPILAPSLGDG